MKINIKATGIELTPAISDYVNKRVSSLDKFLDKDNPSIVANVEVGKDTQHHKTGEVFKGEIHIVGGGHDQYVVRFEPDLYAAIDMAKDEMKLELTRDKGKKESLTRKSARAVKNAMKGLFRRGNE